MDISSLRSYAKTVAEKLFKNAAASVSEFKVAGVTFEGRQYIINKMSEDTSVRLKRDCDNEHDANAVKVEAFVFDTWLTVGWVPKEVNPDIAKKLDAGSSLGITVKSVHGLDTLGVLVSLDKE